MKTICECFKEPKGANGLEGYHFGGLYYYQHEAKDSSDNPYYRIYPTGDMSNTESYYETYSEHTFNQFFRRIT